MMVEKTKEVEAIIERLWVDDENKNTKLFVLVDKV